MMGVDARALHVHTPDQLTRNMVIRPIPDGRPEVVVRTNLVKGKWMVRTVTNLHRMPADLFVPVLAEYVPGLGWVTHTETVA